MNHHIRRYGKVGLCFLGVFLAGALTGAVVTTGALKDRLEKRANPNHWQRQVMQTLDRTLSLRPDQRAKVEPMVAQVIGDCQATRMEAMIRYGRARAELKANVSTVLDADQLKRLERLIQEREQRWKRFLVPEASR